MCVCAYTYVCDTHSLTHIHTRTHGCIGVISIKSTNFRTPDEIIIGQPLLISLYDPDLIDSSTPFIKLQCERIGLSDLEALSLKSSKSATVILETYQNYGYFTGAIDSVSSHPFTSGNGVLEIDKNDVLNAIYNDVYPPVPVTKLLSADKGMAEWPQFQGSISLSPSLLLLPDAILTITVVDYDLDTDKLGGPPGNSEGDWSEKASTVVKVKSCSIQRNGTKEICSPTGHMEYLTLHETADPGTFTGSIQTQTRAGLGGNGVLYRAEPAGRVQVEYIDWSGGISRTAQVRVLSMAELRFEESAAASSAGGCVTVTVVDRDGETDLHEARTTFVNVSLVGSSQPPTVVPLQETGGSTGD